MINNNSIGIYGGAFNPFHKGHEYVIINTKKILKLKKLYIVPSFYNPLKNNKINLSDHNHVKNLRNITKSLDVKVSALEFTLKSKSTFEILENISKKCDLKNFVLIIGLDQLWQLHNWVNFEWIIDRISICIINRPGYDIEIENSEIFKKFPKYFMTSVNTFIRSYSPNLYFANINGINISSTLLRKLK